MVICAKQKIHLLPKPNSHACHFRTYSVPH